MKISQYILLSFLVFVLSATVVLFADSVNAKSDGRTSVFGKSIPQKKLEPFSIIVAKNKANITIKNDTSNTISALLFKTDSVFNLPEYKVVNDTLFVSKSDYAAKTIIKCKAVKMVIGNENSNIYLDNYRSDSLSIRLNKSKVNGWIKNRPIAFMDIEAYNKSNMSYNLNKSSIIDSNLKIDNSKVYLNSNKGTLKNVRAILKRKSNMRIWKANKLDIDCDSLSTYQLY